MTSRELDSLCALAAIGERDWRDVAAALELIPVVGTIGDDVPSVTKPPRLETEGKGGTSP